MWFLEILRLSQGLYLSKLQRKNARDSSTSLVLVDHMCEEDPSPIFALYLCKPFITLHTPTSLICNLYTLEVYIYTSIPI